MNKKLTAKQIEEMIKIIETKGYIVMPKYRMTGGNVDELLKTIAEDLCNSEETINFVMNNDLNDENNE